MLKIIEKSREALNTRAGKIGSAVVLTGSVATLPSLAGATGTDATTVDNAFTTLQGSILGYVGDGIAILVAVMGITLGVRLLVKYVKRTAGAA